MSGGHDGMIYCPYQGAAPGDSRLSWSETGLKRSPPLQLCIDPTIAPHDSEWTVYGVLNREAAFAVRSYTAVETGNTSAGHSFSLSTAVEDLGISDVPLNGVAIDRNRNWWFSASEYSWNRQQWQYPTAASGSYNSVPYNTIQFLGVGGGGGWSTRYL
jgi:hypothetical protein